MKEREEAFFKEVMSKSKLKMPFPDVEDNVMFQIRKEEPAQAVSSKNLKRSWICFIAGTIFGLIISLLIPQFEIPVFGISPDNLAIVFQMVFVLFVLIQLETLIKSTNSIRLKDLFTTNIFVS